jgi:hypothetical protein
MAEDTDPGGRELSELSMKAYELGMAHQLRRESLNLLNIFTIVMPAILSTVVAVIVALPPLPLPPAPTILNSTPFGIPIESFLAGFAAILVVIHKELKCEEYQAECLRLAGLYHSIAIDAKYALHSADDKGGELKRLSEKFASAIKAASVTVPYRYIKKAKEIAKEEGYELKTN